MIDEHDILWLEQTLPFWQDLTRIEQDLVIHNTRLIQYAKGTLVHSGDADCIGLVMIKSGTLRVFMLSEEGRDISLFRLSDNDMCILSASCIIKQITFDVHIEAESDCEVLLINSRTIADLSSTNIHVENYTYKLTADRFSEVMWAMQQILFMGFDKRLAVFLIDEAAKTGSNTLKITHEQIAKYVGSAREVVTRMLRRFADDGLVHLSRGEVEIVNKAKLRALI